MHISDPPDLHRDKQLEKFLIGEECCHNFINQDLTFLQLSTIYEATTQEDGVLPESNLTALPLITLGEANQLQEEDNHPAQAPPTELLYNMTKIAARSTPIQPVEPVVDLTPEEQCQKEEKPDLTLDELLGLSSLEDHISTPLCHSLEISDRLV